MKMYRTNVIIKDSLNLKIKNSQPWYYEQQELGYNYRMTELQAALGLCQIQRLDEFVAKRHKLAHRYNKELENLPLILPFQSDDVYSGLHLYVIRLKLDVIDYSRQQVFERLREAGVGVNVHYIPIHTQPYYQKMGFQTGDFPQAEHYYAEAISLPMFHLMTDTQQSYIIQTLKSILGST